MDTRRRAGIVLQHVLLLLLAGVQMTNAQQARGNGRDKEALKPVQPGSQKFKDREAATCGFIRELNGVCTNDQVPYYGSVGLAQLSYTPEKSSARPSGKKLASARHISNVACSQSGDVLSQRGLSELVTFVGQFLDHCFAATPKNTESLPIPIARDDNAALEEFPSGEMPFTRSRRARDNEKKTSERPINSLPSAVDLAAVYGPGKERLDLLRSFSDGKMLTSVGDNLPFNTMGLSNAPTTASSLFVAGDFRANENPLLTSIHTMFLREHNRFATLLKTTFPLWDEEKLFQTARACNIVQFQRVIFEEFYPAMTGQSLPAYTGFDPNANPTLTDVFTTAAFRIGHTMVGHALPRRGPGMSPMTSVPVAEMFFNPQRFIDDGLEAYVRGAIDSRSQEVDIQVTDSLRNFLFNNVPEEAAMDLVALNLQRGRDHNIPSYQELYRLFRGGNVNKWKDVSPDPAVQSRLEQAYRKVGDVEAFIGLLAEPHVAGASMGETMLILWREEFQRLRDGDRFFYVNRDMIFDAETRSGFKEELDRIYGEANPMASVILRNTGITASELPPSIWFKADR